MVTERMAVDYAQSILVTMKVDDFLQLKINHEDVEEDYLYVNEWGVGWIQVGIDRLVRDFESKIGGESYFQSSKYVKNKDGNSLGFSILHEIGHGILREDEDWPFICVADDVLRWIRYEISDFIDFLIIKKKFSFLKKFSLWIDRMYYYLPEEIYANKFADKNIMSFVPNYGLAE